jgi:hypothetical protein
LSKLSQSVWTFTVEMMPAGMPTKNEIKVAANANSREFGNRWK